MPVQIKMNTNLSNSSRSHSSSFMVQSKGVPVSLGSSSVAQFQNSMIGRVHLSKSGCSSCGH